MCIKIFNIILIVHLFYQEYEGGSRAPGMCSEADEHYNTNTRVFTSQRRGRGRAFGTKIRQRPYSTDTAQPQSQQQPQQQHYQQQPQQYHQQQSQHHQQQPQELNIKIEEDVVEHGLSFDDQDADNASIIKLHLMPIEPFNEGKYIFFSNIYLYIYINIYH